MANSLNSEYRADILSAFDQHAVRSLPEICSHLKEGGKYKSYQSTRRMLQTMKREGLVTQLEARGTRNEIQYSRMTFHTSARLVDYEGNVIRLNQYLAYVANLELPPFINEAATTEIKSLIFDALGSTYPEPYEGKRDVPDPDRIEASLNKALDGLKKVHAFISNFIESGVFSPVARDSLSQEFQTSSAMEHSVIVDKGWDK